MRRTIVRTQEELDDIEDNKWRRKSYALAQHNALPVPMPLPVYPPPKPCPLPASSRPLRSGPRPAFRPVTGYRPSAGYRPSKMSNSLPATPEVLPTLSEVGGATPDTSARDENHIPANTNRVPKAVPPPVVNIPPALPTARPPPPTPNKYPSGPAVPTALPTSPSPRPTSPPALPTKPPPVSRRPVSPRKNPPQPPKCPPTSLSTKSLTPETHPQPQQASVPPPQTHPQPQPANVPPPQTHPPPSLPSTLVSPPSLPIQLPSLPIIATPTQVDNPDTETNHPPVQVDPSSAQVESPPPAQVESPPPAQVESPPPAQVESPPAQKKDPVSHTNRSCSPEDHAVAGTPQVNPPLTHTNSPSRTTNPQPAEVDPLEQTNPPPSTFLSPTLNNNNNLPPTPTSQHLPPTPTSLSRSPTPTSLGCPRTPTSIRAAPWQPYFPPTPLSRTPRTTPTPTSGTPGTSPTPSWRTPGTSPKALPASGQVFPPTPPSSSSHVGVDSVTPASSMSSLNHGQSKTMDDTEVQFTPDMVDASSKLPYPAVLDVTSLKTNVADKVTTVTSNPAGDVADPRNSSTTTPPQDEAYQTYLTRFWILTVFSFIAFLQTVVWGTFGPIAESALAAFPSWTEGTIAAFPNWGPIIVVLFTIPMMWLTQKLGLRLGVLTCALLLTIGTVIRCFTSQETPFTVLCHVSSILFAFAACMTLSLPAMVAAIWFPPNERITATAVGALMCQLGGAAMYMGALVVRTPSSKTPTDEEREEIRSDIMILMYIHFGAAVLLLLVAVVYFPAHPRTPPSASSAKERIDFFSGIRGIIKNPQLLLIIISYALSFGVPVVWIGVLNLSLIDIHIHQKQAMGVAVTAVVCSSAAAFVTARITDKVYGHLRVTIIGFLVLSSLFFLWFLLLSTQVIVPSLAQVYVAVTGGVSFEYATVPLLVELAVETGYPIPESVTGAVLTFCFNLVALVFLGFFQINTSTHVWVSWVLFFAVSVTVLPLLFVKETHKRSDTDRKYIQ